MLLLLVLKNSIPPLDQVRNMFSFFGF